MAKVRFTIESVTLTDQKGEVIPSPSGKAIWKSSEIEGFSVEVGEESLDFGNTLLHYAGKGRWIGNEFMLNEQAQEILDARAAEKAAAKAAASEKGQEAVVEAPAASKKALAAAQDLGVDIEQVAGSGKGGAITVNDVKAAAKEMEPVEQDGPSDSELQEIEVVTAA